MFPMNEIYRKGNRLHNYYKGEDFDIRNESEAIYDFWKKIHHSSFNSLLKLGKIFEQFEEIDEKEFVKMLQIWTKPLENP